MLGWVWMQFESIQLAIGGLVDEFQEDQKEVLRAEGLVGYSRAMKGYSGQ